jgi:hypothetical protein
LLFDEVLGEADAFHVSESICRTGKAADETG